MVEVTAGQVLTLQMEGQPDTQVWGHADADLDTIADQCWILIESL